MKFVKRIFQLRPTKKDTKTFTKDTEITNVIFCRKSFTYSEDLKRHIKIIHEGQRSDSCGKSFTESYSLKTHIKALHEQQKNYKCDYCEKSFATLGNRGKSFTSSHSLKMHIKTIHEGGQIKYICDSCASFSCFVFSPDLIFLKGIGKKFHFRKKNPRKSDT